MQVRDDEGGRGGGLKKKRGRGMEGTLVGKEEGEEGRSSREKGRWEKGGKVIYEAKKVGNRREEGRVDVGLKRGME